VRELIAILNVALEGVNGLSPHILCYSAVTMAAVTSATEPLLSDDRAVDWMGNRVIFFPRSPIGSIDLTLPDSGSLDRLITVPRSHAAA
jgi:hypothetical protein